MARRVLEGEIRALRLLAGLLLQRVAELYILRAMKLARFETARPPKGANEMSWLTLTFKVRRYHSLIEPPKIARKFQRQNGLGSTNIII